MTFGKSNTGEIDRVLKKPEQTVTMTFEHNDKCHRSEGYPIGTISANNTSVVSRHIFVTIAFDDGIKIERTLDVIPGRSKKVLKLKDSVLDRLCGSSVRCVIKVVDPYARTILSEEFSVSFADSPDCSVRAKASIVMDEIVDIDGEDEVRVADVSLIAFDDSCKDVVVKVFINKRSASEILLKATDKESLNPIKLKSSSFKRSGSYRIHMKVECNDILLDDKSLIVNVKLSERPRLSESEDISEKAITVSFCPLEMVDVHEVDNSGNVVIGSLNIDSRIDQEIVVALIVTIPDKTCYRQIIVTPGWSRVDVYLSPKLLYREDFYDLNVRIKVTGKKANDYLDNEYVVPIRSMFDLCIDKIGNRVAQFTNPYDAEVGKMCEGINSSIQKYLGSNSVCGYCSGPDAIVPQMRAVFEMLRDLGLKYDSYTLTPLSSKQSFQRVRTPGVILDENKKVGNCIDLSIMLASFYERLGLHPFIVITVGHAYLGVEIMNGNNESAVLSDNDGAASLKFTYGGKEINAIMVESTYLADRGSSFLGATVCGCKEMHDDIERSVILDCCFIGDKRLKGIKSLRL